MTTTTVLPQLDDAATDDLLGWVDAQEAAA
jgi:hypothetical protein